MTPKDLEQRSIEDLTPYARNSRTHSEAQVAQIAASIIEFGFTNPILVDAEGGIIAGHGRVLAAQSLGLESVPVLVLDHLTEDQRRAYVIADNKLALNAGWDEDLLRQEIEALQAESVDLTLLGFDDAELAELLNLPCESDADPDDVPEPPAIPVTRRGDVWLLGNHRLLCGDSCDANDVHALMKGELADMLFTDPPWNVNYGAVKDGNAQGYKVRTIINDHMGVDDWAKFVEGFTTQFRAATKPGAPAYVVMSAQEWPVVDGAIRQAGFHWSSSIIWVKDTLVLSRKDYHTRYEPIWYGWNASAPRLVALKDRKQDDVWEIPRPKQSELHPTTKPVELIERALKNSSVAKSLVLDLFGGSGSTLIACERQGRRARLMELDPKYADVIVQRWEEFVGRVATLEATGQSFREVADERRALSA